MKELMLTLLTYEPFQKFTKCYSDEKKYIDAILNGETSFPGSRYQVYHDLFSGFKKYCDEKLCKKAKFSPSDLNWLNVWKQLYYPSSNYMKKGSREQYPILFKKICSYIIINTNMPDTIILGAIGLRDNLLDKWGVSTRYRKIMNKDTAVTPKLYRNGQKRGYITNVVKMLYYEANRLTQENTFGDHYAPTKPNSHHPYPFVDVFAGTGSVAASMNVPGDQLILNDADVGTACFLYTISKDTQQLRIRLAALHNINMKKRFGKEERYSEKDYNDHPPINHKYNEIIEALIAEIVADTEKDNIGETQKDFLLRVRNNYIYICDLLDVVRSRISSIDFYSNINLNSQFDLNSDLESFDIDKECYKKAMSLT